MNDFEKLNAIQKRNGDIKAFPLNSNLANTYTGSNSWGKMTIAVDNVSVQRVLTDDVVGILYIVGKDEWEKEGAE